MKDEPGQGRTEERARARRGRSDSSFIGLTSSFWLKRWRRTLLLAALLLLAGALVNVAVAWGCISRKPMIDGKQVGWFVEAMTSDGDQISQRTYAGWPARSLVASYTIVLPKDGRSAYVIRPMLRIPGWATRDPLADPLSFLPLRPIFPGFLLNTLFYAVVVGAILALPLSLVPLRRRLRARRGRCPKCNYDLAGLDGPCPECGGERH